MPFSLVVITQYSSMIRASGPSTRLLSLYSSAFTSINRSLRPKALWLSEANSDNLASTFMEAR